MQQDVAVELTWQGLFLLSYCIPFIHEAQTASRLHINQRLKSLPRNSLSSYMIYNLWVALYLYTPICIYPFRYSLPYAIIPLDFRGRGLIKTIYTLRKLEINMTICMFILLKHNYITHNKNSEI